MRMEEKEKTEVTQEAETKTEKEATSMNDDITKNPSYIAMKDMLDDKLKELDRMSKELNRLKVEKEKMALQYSVDREDTTVDDSFLAMSRFNIKRGDK